MVSNLLQDKKMNQFVQLFEKFLKNHFNQYQPMAFRGHQRLLESIRYTLFTSGKRFRPLLIFSTAEICGLRTNLILPWAGAIEVIHTASLIHDDLPCMDNSYSRRKQATNHRLFGENIALLAGNCLWIEAFRIIEPYIKHTNWLSLLCQAAGFNGLMGGQALDLNPEPSEKYYNNLHKMKTAALMESSIKGVLSLQQQSLRGLYKAASLIGSAFQLADDLEDDTEDQKSNITVLGKRPAQKKLQELSSTILKLIQPYTKTNYLTKLILFNANRVGVAI